MKNGDIARNLGSNIAEGVGHIVDVGRKAVVDTASDAKDVVVERGGKAMTALTKVVRKHPLASIGIAFGIGYIAMRFMRR